VGKEEEGRAYHSQLRSPHSSSCICGIFVGESRVPVRACETREREDQAEEDDEEDDVSSQGADEEDEADESYNQSINQPLPHSRPGFQYPYP